MKTQLITGPQDEPLSILEVRMHLRNPEITTNDSELLDFITAAREQAEHKTGRALAPQTWEAYLDSFTSDTPYIELPYPPLQSVTSITYLDSSEVLQTLDAADYVVDTSSHPGQVRLAYNKSWPTTLGTENAISIRYVAGYASADAIPQVIKQWMKLAVEAFDKNRGLMQEREVFLTPFAERLLDSERIVGV